MFALCAWADTQVCPYTKPARAITRIAPTDCTTKYVAHPMRGLKVVPDAFVIFGVFAGFFEAGEVIEYSINMGNVANVFKAGHRIKLEIDTILGPRDPEIQIHYHPLLNSSKTTLHKIYRNKEYQSHLVLPIISGKEEVMEVMSDDNFQGI